MADLSARRREWPPENVPVALTWADRLLSELTPSRIFREMASWMMKEPGELTPAFDIADADDHFAVEADLPGIAPKDLDVSLAGNVLTIRGEKKEEREEKKEHYYSMERRFGSFSRSFMLPADVREDEIEASYKDGVLRVIIPKAERAKQKKIAVKIN